MGFPVEKPSNSIETSVEKLVNVEKIDGSDKEEPVVTPVNANVDRSQLGKSLDVQRPNASGIGIVPSMRSKTGAGINNISARPKTHDVIIEDHSLNSNRVYNYKVHCNTCGWEGRYAVKERADQTAQNHKDANAA